MIQKFENEKEALKKIMTLRNQLGNAAKIFSRDEKRLHFKVAHSEKMWMTTKARSKRS